MLISCQNTMRSLIFASVLLFSAGLHADDAGAAKQNDRWSQVEAEAANAKKESAQRVEAEAAEVAKREAEAWKQLDSKKAQPGAEADAEAVAKREAEEWKQLDSKKAKSVAEAEKIVAEERKTGAARAERDLALEQMKAELAAERARAEAAEKARIEAENAKALTEAQLQRVKAETAEQARAEAAEKARIEAELQRVKAEQEKTAKSNVENPVAASSGAAGVPSAREDADDGEGWGAKAGRAILWYIPNRLSDLMDVFTVEIGAGELGVDLQLTRYASLGAGIGLSHMLGWSICNQHGIYRQQGWYVDLLNSRFADVRRDEVCGAYTQFFRTDNGRVDIGEMADAKAEDPYAIGVKACCYLNLKLQFHVTELADFIAGIFFIDFKDDDKPQINWVF